MLVISLLKSTEQTMYYSVIEIPKSTCFVKTSKK